MSIESRLQKLEGEIRRIRQHGHTSRHDGGLLEGAAINGVIGGPGDTGGGMPGSGGSGTAGPHGHNAASITYDNSATDISGTTVQAAIDQLADGIDEPVQSVPISGSSVEIDYAIARWWDITVTDDVTYTIVNPPEAGYAGQLHIVRRVVAGAGPFTETWPASVDWGEGDGTGGGSSPALSYSGSEDTQETVVLTTFDGGTTWGGSYDSATSGSVDAEDVAITDAGGYYDGSDVEAALAEIGSGGIGRWELLMDGGSPPTPLEDGTGTDWLYVWVPG